MNSGIDIERFGGTAIKINLAGFSDRSTVNGPGLRGVIWVQGCPIRCPGCFNKELWDFRPRYVMNVDDLVSQVLKIRDIEGITFSGGEPFTQAAALGDVGMHLQENGLNIVTFSGFPYAYLREKNRKSWRSLLRVTDLLISGPYKPGNRSTYPLISSSNQSMVFLSDRLKDRISVDQPHREVELLFGSGGEITMTGFPDHALLQNLSSQDCRKGDIHVTLQQN
jgi:anaerobic ribonucleoside-triphosphate reductase activating protein